MSIQRKLTCLILLLLPLYTVHAQDAAWQTMNQICANYDRNNGSLYYKADMKMYTATAAARQIDRIQAICTVEREHCYMKIGAIEMVVNSRYTLTIDHDDKLVVVAKGGVKDKPQDMLLNMGRLLEGMKSIGVRLQQVMRGNESWLELTDLPDDEVKQCNIQYDPVTHTIKRLWMKTTANTSGNISEPVIVDIAYTYIAGPEKQAAPDEKKFIRNDGKGLALMPLYQHYTLINQL